MNESSDNDTNDIMGRGAKEKTDKGGENQNNSEKVEASTKAGTREAPIDAPVLFLTDDSTNSRKAKATGKNQNDKEVTKKKRIDVQPVITNDDGICFSKNGQYCLDMSHRYELYAASEKWIKTLCIQNKVWFYEQNKAFDANGSLTLADPNSGSLYSHWGLGSESLNFQHIPFVAKERTL